MQRKTKKNKIKLFLSFFNWSMQRKTKENKIGWQIERKRDKLYKMTYYVGRLCV
jgi:hypothetical protein